VYDASRCVRRSGRRALDLLVEGSATVHSGADALGEPIDSRPFTVPGSWVDPTNPERLAARLVAVQRQAGPVHLGDPKRLHLRRRRQLGRLDAQGHHRRPGTEHADLGLERLHQPHAVTGYHPPDDLRFLYDPSRERHKKDPTCQPWSPPGWRGRTGRLG
jgi:hypothetical protein